MEGWGGLPHRWPLAACTPVGMGNLRPAGLNCSLKAPWGQWRLSCLHRGRGTQLCCFPWWGEPQFWAFIVDPHIP